ncbi:hypothetical protein, partial [Mycoplasmopsis bovis]|uniref:hypothetical protein n=1 Tax=Mycoplasmopsis bovis TaxID=28903 RepID=UPI001CF590E7
IKKTIKIKLLIKNKIYYKIIKQMTIKVIQESRYWLKIALMIFNEDLNPSLPFFVTEYSQNLYDTVSPFVFF